MKLSNCCGISASTLDEEQRKALAKMLKPRTTKYIPVKFTPKQALFLNHPAEEVLFGGAAGGGKSVAGLGGALQYVDVPGYNALVLRRNLALIEKGKALIPMSHEWLDGTDAVWHDKIKTWKFPSGAAVSFGYLADRNDWLNYRGTEWNYIFIDELTEIPWEEAYDNLHSRMRRPSDPDDPLSHVPLRIRAATNPGGQGHEWTKRKFILPYEEFQARRVAGEFKPQPLDVPAFIPARLEDNPYIDQTDYRKRLNLLHPIIRDQLLHGIWDIAVEGNVFKTAWWKTVPIEYVPEVLRMVRYWDLAASEERGDFIVGLLLGEANNHYYVLDLVRGQFTPEAVVEVIRSVAERDGAGVRQVVELEPGASSLILATYLKKHILKGVAYIEDRPRGSKLARAFPVASAVASGFVELVEAAWNAVLIRETGLFPSAKEHDDIVDTLSGGYNFLVRAGSSKPSVHQVSGGQRAPSQSWTGRNDRELPILPGGNW